MGTRAAIRQLARLLGRDELYRRLGLEEGWQPGELSDEQLAGVQALVDERLEDLALALAREAMASDDVLDTGSAVLYLEDRLAFFDELLTEEQREAIRARFREVASRWG
jgi:hypothetical protein